MERQPSYPCRDGFLSYEQVGVFLDRLLESFPQFVKREIVGRSYENREIYAYLLHRETEHDSSNIPDLLITSLLHGREPVTVSASLFFMESLVREAQVPSSESSYLLTTRRIFVVPMLNPDSYYAGSMDGSFKYRKNRRPTCETDSEAGGVDLNRNFDYHWTKSSDPCDLEYSGTEPFSEPETRVLRDYVLKKNFLAAFHIHSYGNILTYPFNWGSSERIKPQHQKFLDEIQSVMGFEKFGPASVSLGYSTFGESDDWFYAKAGVLSISPEIGSSADGFLPPADHLSEICATTNDRIRYWAYKCGAELSVDGLETGSIILKNSGLSDWNGRLEVLIESGERTCRVDMNITVPHNDVNKRTELPDCDYDITGTVCLNEMSLNCRCFDVVNGSFAEAIGGKISIAPRFPGHLGTEPEIRARELESADLSSPDYGMIAIVILIGIIFSFFVGRLIRRTLFPRQAVYIEMAEQGLSPTEIGFTR
jgi:hypothetical protein